MIESAFTHTGITVTLVGEEEVTIDADEDATHDWAERTGRRWPLSGLKGHAVIASFDKGGLYRLQIDSNAESSGDELSAFCSDVAGAVLHPEHPTYHVLVGQFEKE